MYIFYVEGNNPSSFLFYSLSPRVHAKHSFIGNSLYSITMNRKKTIFSFLLVGFMVVSLLTANLTSGIVVTDQLVIPDGTYTDGKLLYTNTTHTDSLLAYSTFKVERIFTPSDISDKLIEINHKIEIVDYEYELVGFIQNENHVEFTFYVFYDNRTTLLMPRVFMGNDTESIEISLMAQTTFSGMSDIDNTIITYKNGTTFKYGDVLITDPEFTEIDGLTYMLKAFSDARSAQYMKTLFGISPTANVGDDISYLSTVVPVMAKPAVVSTDGKSYDSIQVHYPCTSIFGFWVAELKVFYEASTGFILRVIESLGAESIEFVPGKFKSGSGIPFSTTGIVLGFIAIGLIAIVRRKKK